MNKEKKISRRKSICGTVALILLPVIFVGGYLFFDDTDPVPEPAVMKYETAPLPEPVAEEITVASETDKERAKEQAINFIAAFHAVDYKDPFAYFDNAKEYMTEEMKKEYEGIPKRATLAAEELNITHMEWSPTELQEDLQVWSVGITSEATAKDGTTEYVFTNYLILLEKVGSDWKVGRVGAE